MTRETAKIKEEEIRKVVRDGYATIAKSGSSCCSPTSSCCSTNASQEISKGIGYTEKELEAVPEGANLGLGCGNPVAFTSLREGETVLDLGSGAGFDCFLAANKVGKSGKVIGVDMTPEMIEKAREHARKGSYENVEFRLGEIENLPAADGSVDVVISNCAINLAPDKERVFKEAFRVLRPRGRLLVSDIVLSRELPSSIRDSMQAYVSCLAGATMKDEYLQIIRKAGFQQVRIIDEAPFPVEFGVNDTTGRAPRKSRIVDEAKELASSVLSVSVSGVKLG
jgi:SAM-dependent methyltransferase